MPELPAPSFNVDGKRGTGGTDVSTVFPQVGKANSRGAVGSKEVKSKVSENSLNYGKEVVSLPSANSLNYEEQVKFKKVESFPSENSLNYMQEERGSNFSEKLNRHVASEKDKSYEKRRKCDELGAGEKLAPVTRRRTGEAKASENSVNYGGEKEEGKLDEARALSFEESAVDRLMEKESCAKPSAISLNYDEPVSK